jgi:hypothetical protein
MCDESDVRRIALALPETVQDKIGTGYIIKGKPFVWIYYERVAPKKPRIPHFDVLVVRVSGEGEKQLLLASNPAIFFTTTQYNGYPAVLVRLPAIALDELTELITDAWRGQAPKNLVKKFDAVQEAS